MWEKTPRVSHGLLTPNQLVHGSTRLDCLKVLPFVQYLPKLWKHLDFYAGSIEVMEHR